MSGKKLLQRIREEIRRRNYSYSTEKAYCHWVVRYIKFYNMTHPSELQSSHVVQFLNHLANERRRFLIYPKPGIIRTGFFSMNIFLKAPVGEIERSSAGKKVPAPSGGAVKRGGEVHS
jgi:hypothetical protein